MDEIRGSRVLILGYGREGQSVHRYLHAHFPNLKIGIADMHPIKPLFDDIIQTHNGKAYLESLTDYDTVVRSPGVPLSLPRVKKIIRSRQHITSATNIFFSLCRGQTIGVTGTKGKSTTSSLIYHLLKSTVADVRLVGNIGRPALDQLAEQTKDTVFVVELSSHQLEDCQFSPQIAVILSIVPEHFDHFQTFNKYISAKAHIIKYQSRSDWVVFNPTHRRVRKIAQMSPAKKIMYSMLQLPQITYWTNKNKIFMRRNHGVESILSVADIPLIGPGNVENTLAAIAVARLYRVSLGRIQASLRRFRPLPHRLEKVGKFKGITFYNDSLSTIPESAIHALEAFRPRVATLIAGGKDRGLDYDELGKYIANYVGLKTLILFPETGARIWSAINKYTSGKDRRFNTLTTDSMKVAVRFAYAHTPRGTICVLSPAAASFNLFRDYKARGNVFKKYVKSYAKDT